MLKEVDAESAHVLSPEGAETELDSVTLSRLIEEVRSTSVQPTAYNRMHNRHNRT